MNFRGNRLQSDGTDFWKLWVQYQDYLYQRCLSWMKGNPTDAQEALSRASIKAWEKWQDDPGKIANPKAWMTRLTHNLCMDMHRERSREARGIESVEEIAIAEDNILSSELPLLDHERNSYLPHAINTLPTKVRIPFILWYEQEMSYSEIAQQLALSHEKVRKRVQQARTILKKQLSKYFCQLDSSSPSATYWNSPLKKEVRSKEYQESDLAMGEGQLDREFMKLALEKFVSEPIRTSGCKTPVTSGCDLESIDYKVTATCLEILSRTWYSSPSCLRWR
ncbi:MAG: sigma-70 family RNA polymerase sigma factor [Coleofasciculaceae cyanobacterium]